MSIEDVNRKINKYITEITNCNKKLKQAQARFKKVIQMKNSKEFQIFIKDLNLPTRVKNVMKYCFEIDTLAELLEYSCKDFLEVYHFGPGCLNALKTELKRLGYVLREK